jgi:hypothetical protein
VRGRIWLWEGWKASVVLTPEEGNVDLIGVVFYQEIVG